ncbi:Hybrid sensor histidine kinase/response regulator [Burkholderiales bacterium 8X]|nr:Hybrid sensor histidine kinase/response regulator [Burkholderiales bacterium 8X]
MTTLPTDPNRYDSIFVGRSEMAELMRRHDWAATPLGPPEGWPDELKVALRILLTSRFEMWLGWGPEVHFFYNDAYRPTLGKKHPNALAKPTRELWREIWDDIKDRIHTVYDQGESTWDRSLMLLLERSGFPEETYHTFSYSPLLGNDGKVQGLFCAVSEDTERILSERRLRTLRELAAGLAASDTRAQVFANVQDVLGKATRDLPFSLLYLLDEQGHARLTCACGIAPGHPLAPEHYATGLGHPWEFERLLAGEGSFVLGLADVADVPCGPWSRPSPAAMVVGLSAPGSSRLSGFLVGGVNPHLMLGEDYASFIHLVAGQVAAGLSNVEALEASLAERTRLRNLFEQAPGFMCVLSGPEHICELTNRSYQQLIGHRPVEGKSIREALPELVGQGFFELLDEVYRTGRTYLGRGSSIRLQLEPGGPLVERIVDFVYQPIRDASGAVTGIFAEGSDVTDKAEAENELRLLNESLELRIADRTRDLEEALERLREESREREAVQDALRQSQKMEAVGQLTGGLAHDFNNLLASISGSLELMQRRLAQGRVSELDRYITVGHGAAKRAAALTHRMLAFSRRQTLEPKAIDLNRLVGGMEELIRRTMGPEILVEVVGSVGLWTTLVDPSQLDNALLNLCINARDAMPDGGRLTIETSNKWMDERAGRERDLPAGQYVALCVTDTGTGMSQEVRNRAFEPFFTTKPMGMGTGLGLSMVYGFARQSGGQVRIYSELGLGTTMCIYLPRHLDAADTGTAEEHYLPNRAEVGAGTVLIVDDETNVRGVVKEVLEDMGLGSIEAEDGASAMTLLDHKASIDLLITDVGLPGGMNGRQLADAARASRPGLKVLFITGYAENAVIGNGHLEPGMRVLTKPFTLDALALRIRDLLAEPPTPVSDALPLD